MKKINKKNSNSIYNNHFTTIINGQEIKSDINGLEEMKKRVQPHNVNKFKEKILKLVNGGENILEFEKKIKEEFNNYFTIPNISVPLQPYSSLIEKGRVLYRVVNDDNKKYEYGRPAEEVTMAGRLNEKNKRCIYFSFYKEIAISEAKRWGLKSSNEKFYLTKYTVIQDFEIEFMNYVDFQSKLFSKIDRHIARIHSEIRNYFLIMKAPEDKVAEEKFYLLTNFIKNWKTIGNVNGLVFVSSLMKHTDMEYSERADRITYNPNANLVIYDSKNKIEDLVIKSEEIVLN